MATLTRVPFIYSSSPSTTVGQTHNKYRQVALSTPFLNSLPEFSTHGFHASYSYSSSLSFAGKTSRKSCSRGAVKVLAMADSSRSTVLVTGAGGRTGNFALPFHPPASFFFGLGFIWNISLIISFLSLYCMIISDFNVYVV